MNARRALVALAVALLALLAWRLWPRDESPALALAPGAADPARPAPLPAAPAPPEPRSTLADSLNAPDATIQADLRVVGGLVDAYRSNFHENPVGTNAEITAALMGRNRLDLALLPPDHPAVNPRGELCDRWGRPFFFHQLSGTRLELRSAGPDRQLWTGDDVVLTP